MKKDKNDKSILEESLIDFQDIEKMISKTSKGTLKDILSEKVKEGLKNIITEADDFEEEDVDVDNVEDNEDGLEDTKPESDVELDGENEPDELDGEGDDLEADGEELDADDLETDLEDGDGMDSEDDELDDEEEDFDLEKFKTDDDEYDLTNNSIEDVVKVFKKIDDNDSVIVKKLENGMIELVDDENGTEYLIDLGDEDVEFDIEDNELDEEELENDDFETEEDLNEETEIEIELDGAESMVDEKNMTQSIGTNRRGGKMTQTRKEYAPGVNNRDGSQLISKVYESKIKKIEEAYAKKYKELNEEISQYKQALGMFRDKLKENAVLNNNLAKYVKLVTENATTKNEKIEILKRFSNEANTIESGNNLYESIQRSLSGNQKNEINIDKQFSVQSQPKKLDEQVIYQSKDLMETIGLINRMNGLGKK